MAGNKTHIRVRQQWVVVFFVLLTSANAFAEPSVLAYSPQFSKIPANTLRLYVTFSESMSIGQVRDKIFLVDSRGKRVTNPFLNLNTELWDSEQKILTLLFDPGRIKRHVGPNLVAGSPLAVGNTYQLLIDGSMESANGNELGSDRSMMYQIVEAINDAILVDNWELSAPENDKAPVSIKFDRLMDTVAASRLITVLDSSLERVAGVAETDGRTWWFIPQKTWSDDTFHLSVHSELEDVSGNTQRAAFDAPSGTIGKTIAAATIQFGVGKSLPDD